MKKRGPAKWLLDDPTVLSQIDDQTAAKAETAHHLDVQNILKKGLSKEEKTKQIKTIAEQMRDRYASMRGIEEKIQMEKLRQQRKRDEASRSDTAEAAVEKFNIMKYNFPQIHTPLHCSHHRQRAREKKMMKKKMLNETSHGNFF